MTYNRYRRAIKLNSIIHSFNIELFKFIKYLYVSSRYASDMYKDWQLSGSSCVKLDSACEAYVNYKKEVAKTMELPYNFIAMIPCMKLWPWLGQKFKEEGVSVGCLLFQ